MEIKAQIHQVLKQNWGYDSFRYLQEDIILSVLSGKDTLALLPTGGGKSICFQVPALVKPGLCLVITPLIALMKDQVENLKKQGIKAAAIYSGMSYRELDRTFDNAIYNNFKFLYVSPERLETDLFLSRAEKLKPNLIAVDEAHCISQWGYDFRPSYLKIAEIRKYFPKTPIIALTATATPLVVDDIKQKLNFRNSSFFQKSFDRDNLIYAVVKEEAKKPKLLSVIRKIPGTAIVYVRSRRLARELAVFLKQNQVSADYYHAGLNMQDRNRKQEEWKNNQTRVIVSTNAFGMGIDKADVRTVIHYNLPESLEAYYQEAGRAGRDGKKSYALALINESDRTELLKRIEYSFPPVSYIRQVYNQIGKFLQIPLGSGGNTTHRFNFDAFCSRYNLKKLQTYYALNELKNSDIIQLSEEIELPSRLIINVSYNDLYRYQVDNPNLDPIIKILLRSYAGLFENYINISESELAKRLNISTEKCIQYLNYMHKSELIDYIPQSNEPQLYFLHNRVAAESLNINLDYYRTRQQSFEKKINAVIEYAFSTNQCRSQILLSYFGEKFENACGHCDDCIEKRKKEMNTEEYHKIQAKILNLLGSGSKKAEDIMEQLLPIEAKKTELCLKWLLDNNKLKLTPENTISLN